MPALFYFELHAAAAAETAMANGDGALIGGNAAMNDAGRGLFVYGSAFTGSASDDLVVVTAAGRWKRAQPANPAIPILGGGVADAAADSGNPVKVGGRAVSALPTAAANNNRADFITTLDRRLIFSPYANPENAVSGAITTAMTGTADSTLLAAAGSGLRNYITTLIVSNAHATVGTDVVIKEGSTVLLTIPAAAAYGGAAITLPTPLRQPTANTAIVAANITTGSSTKVSAVGFKAA